MIIKGNILNNLKELDRLFQGARVVRHEEFYAKLAILELCGWIEESMDDIICRCYKKKLSIEKNKEFIEKEVIGSTYGFHYEKHFRPMLFKTMGIITVEKLEQRVNTAKFVVLKSTLGNLKEQRDRAAHTHIKGIQRQMDAPSVTINNFIRIYDGLKNIDSVLKALKLL